MSEYEVSINPGNHRIEVEAKNEQGAIDEALDRLELTNDILCDAEFSIRELPYGMARTVERD